MSKRAFSFVRRGFNDRRGQVLPWLALGMTAMLGMAGMSVDIGHAYVVRAQLQNDANAAALAAAGQVYVNQSQSVNSTTEADLYSGSSGGENANSHLGVVTTTVTPACVNMLMPSGTSCTSNSPANAIQVKQTTSVPTWLLGVLGFSSIPVGATATASMGGIAQPWNIAIIEDATGSMANADTNCGGITVFMKVAHLAEAYNLPLTSHGAHDLTVHLLAAAPNRSYLEVHGFGLDRYIAHPMEMRDGKAMAPDRPGHGVAFDWAALAGTQPG